MGEPQIFDEVRGLYACLGAGLPEPYLLEAGELDLPRAKCLAWTPFGSTGDHLKQILIDRGEWDREAPIVVFDLEGLACDALGRGLTFRQVVFETAVHELAHQREYETPKVASAPTPESIEATTESYIEFASQPAWQPSGALPAWHEDHGPGFTRAALHLFWRAVAAGYDVAGSPCGGIDYELSPAWKLLEALGDEPQRMAGATLGELIETRAPAEFNQLVWDDIAYFAEKKS